MINSTTVQLYMYKHFEFSANWEKKIMYSVQIINALVHVRYMNVI